MDHWKCLSAIFNCWNFCFKIITEWWTTYGRFCNWRQTNFYEIFKIFVVINQKLCSVYSQISVWVMSTQVSSKSERWPKIPSWFDPELPVQDLWRVMFKEKKTWGSLHLLWIFERQILTILSYIKWHTCTNHMRLLVVYGC